MVKLSCPTLIHPVIQTALPEAMTADSVEASAGWADVIGAGPGLSLSDRARKELLFVLQQTLQPLVLDADAINLIAKDEALLQELIEHQQNPATRRKLILTPHPGELARLEGCAIEEILKQPVFYAKSGRIVCRQLFCVRVREALQLRRTAAFISIAAATAAWRWPGAETY